ncbi:FAD-dependent oxidoreductase [Rhizobium yanglingense]
MIVGRRRAGQHRELLGLETLGVKIGARLTVVTLTVYGLTSVPGIYAIGDVAGPPMLAHKAEHEGVICVETHRRPAHARRWTRRKIPGCTYCQSADRLRRPHRSQGEGAGLRHPRRPLPLHRQRQGDRARRGRGLREDVIFDKKTGELLGAHMVGAEVTELIQGFVDRA